VPSRHPPDWRFGRTAALGDVFDARVKLPEFLEETKKPALEARQQSGAKVEQLLREVYSYPADVVKSPPTR
jgi:hypothetical protein